MTSSSLMLETAIFNKWISNGFRNFVPYCVIFQSGIGHAGSCTKNYGRVFVIKVSMSTHSMIHVNDVINYANIDFRRKSVLYLTTSVNIDM